MTTLEQIEEAMQDLIPRTSLSYSDLCRMEAAAKRLEAFAKRYAAIELLCSNVGLREGIEILSFLVRGDTK